MGVDYGIQVDTKASPREYLLILVGELGLSVPVVEANGRPWVNLPGFSATARVAHPRLDIAVTKKAVGITPTVAVVLRVTNLSDMNSLFRASMGVLVHRSNEDAWFHNDRETICIRRGARLFVDNSRPDGQLVIQGYLAPLQIPYEVIG